MAGQLWNLFTTPVYTPTLILTNGTVEFFYPGTTGASNRKDVYLDVSLSTVAANPYTLDANATAALYADFDESYHIIIKDKFGATVYDYDYVKPSTFLSQLTGDSATLTLWGATAAGGETSLSPPYTFSSAIVFRNGIAQNTGDTDTFYVSNSDIFFTTPLFEGEQVFAILGALPLTQVTPNLYTTTELEDVTDAVNTTGKAEGIMVFNSTTTKPCWAAGSTAAAVWVNADGTTAHTPV